jgi:hypothetical protein
MDDEAGKIITIAISSESPAIEIDWFICSQSEPEPGEESSEANGLFERVFRWWLRGDED